MPTVVFISYQRDDTLFAAHAMAYALRGAGCVAFVDTGNIGGGKLVGQTIRRALSQSNVMLAMIGRSFCVDRLCEPRSFVAFEWRQAQFYGIAVVPVLVDGGVMPSGADLLPALRWITRRNAYSLRRETLAKDITALVDAVSLLAKEPRRAARVLWVDDNPANNESERMALRPYGLVFDNVVSTAEAVEQLAGEDYDLVITDLGRECGSDQSSEAGVVLLKHALIRVGGPPVIVYASVRALERRDELIGLGAVDVTTDRGQLERAVLAVLGRLPETEDDAV